MCTTRTHGCCYKNTAEPICPYHTAIRHLRRLRRTFGNDFDSPERDVPLFPNEHGNYRSHAEAIKTIQDVIGVTGESLPDPEWTANHCSDLLNKYSAYHGPR
jgi:hypothetical protein